MNLKLRFKNPATCLSLVTSAITFIYQVLGIFGIVPAVSQDMWIQLAGLVINILFTLGILVDPTTSGVKDSVQAQEYSSPRKTRYITEEELAQVYGIEVVDADTTSMDDEELDLSDVENVDAEKGGE